MATGKGRNIDPAMVGKGKKGKGKPKGHNIDPALVGKGRPGHAHPAMLKHMKTEIGGVWLEPPPEEEPAQDQEPRPEAEGQESVEDEGYDGVVKTGVDDENVDVIPEEQEEPSQDQKPPPEAECQEPYGGFLSVPPRRGSIFS